MQQTQTAIKAKEKERADIDDQINAFFAQGGKIKKLKSRQCTTPVANMTNAGHPLGN